MNVYRISSKRYANLDGVGGLYAWGRWHEKGMRVVYCAESRALAAWEKLVHVSSIGLLPDNLVMMEIQIPEKYIQDLPSKILVNGWDGYPYIYETVEFGTKFLSNSENLVLRVPSAIIENEFNYLINPLSKEIGRCKISKVTPFNFDNRILK